MNNKFSLFVFFILLIGELNLKAQSYLGWDVLADVTFESEVSESFGIEILTATFGESVKAMEGEEVIISGYLVPVDAMGTTFVLSRNPNATCFFCGGAGPESVMGLRFAAGSGRRFKTDEYVSFQGTLRIYESNERQFNYMLDGAEEMGDDPFGF